MSLVPLHLAIDTTIPFLSVSFRICKSKSKVILTNGLYIPEIIFWNEKFISIKTTFITSFLENKNTPKGNRIPVLSSKRKYPKPLDDESLNTE